MGQLQGLIRRISQRSCLRQHGRTLRLVAWNRYPSIFQHSSMFELHNYQDISGYTTAQTNASFFSETQLLPPCREAAELDELDEQLVLFLAISPKVGNEDLYVILYFELFWLFPPWSLQLLLGPEGNLLIFNQATTLVIGIQWNSIQAWSSGFDSFLHCWLIQVISNPVQLTCHMIQAEAWNI